jgi:hypothetical protein
MLSERKRMLRAARRKVAHFENLMNRILKEPGGDVARYAAAIALWDGANSVYKRISKSKY